MTSTRLGVQRCQWKQGFGWDTQSRGLIKPGHGHSYLRIFISHNLKMTNRPFLSCLKPLFQIEANCQAIDTKMIFFILMQITLIFTTKVSHLASPEGVFKGDRISSLPTGCHCWLVGHHANKTMKKECCFPLSRRLWGGKKYELS